MSRYATSHLMWEITRDHGLANRFRTDPESVFAGRDLTARERRALQKAELSTLFDFGIHPFVLYHFALRLADGFSLPFVQDYVGQLKGLTVGDLET